MIEIGRVFSTGWRMLRQRLWLMLGMCAVFLAIQFGAFMVMGIGFLLLGTAGAAGFSGAIEDPSAMMGLGIGLLLVFVLLYAAYLVLLLAQQAALVTLASPLEDASFGAAMGRGFKSAPPFFVILVIMLLGYFALAALMAGLSLAVGGNTIVTLLFLPVMAYLACRLSVLVPVVAVDQIYNPLKAIRRAWSLTRGKVLGIFVTLLIYTVGVVAIIATPILLLTNVADGGGASPEAAAGAALGVFLLVFPLLFFYLITLSAMAASLHHELTGGGAEALEEVFA